MHDKVFISYAKEDITFAEILYDYLLQNDFHPWLDKKDLLPGQDWNFTIRKALRDADYIILLLSSNSVSKRGYVQREFKLAVEYYEEKLEDDIYLIPLKINDCTVPDRLSKFQWIENNDSESFDRMLASLTIQREKIAAWERKQIAAKELFAYEERKESFNYAREIKFDLDISYVQFVDATNLNLRELNNIILGKKTENIITARKSFHESSGEIIDASGERMGWSFSFSFDINYLSKSVVSINEGYYAFTGGAHGNYYNQGWNYHVNPVFQIDLQDLFHQEDSDNVLELFSVFCYEELRRRFNEWMHTSEKEIARQTRKNMFWGDSIDAKWDNYENFLISKAGLEVIFNPYSVSNYAFGGHNVLIPYEKINDVLRFPIRLEI